MPVKAEHRGDVPGLVHDTSGSGATLFVEPAQVVEINNQLKVLEGREQQEIERILAELSRGCGTGRSRFHPARTTRRCCHLRLHLRTRQAVVSAECLRAALDPRTPVNLHRARHPLLDLKRPLCPSTSPSGRDDDTLVITGPNTGG